VLNVQWVCVYPISLTYKQHTYVMPLEPQRQHQSDSNPSAAVFNEESKENKDGYP
jgi:hypothetical protein